MWLNHFASSYGSGRRMTSMKRKANLAGQRKRPGKPSGFKRIQLYGGYAAAVPRWNKAPEGLIINKISRQELLAAIIRLGIKA